MAHRHRLLVVEDNPDTRCAMKLVLSGSGYGVDTAANGRDALDKLHHEEPPCLILLDLMMPVMDGWQFRDEQRRDPSLASVPVVVLSADNHVAQSAAELGADSYLTKPVDLDDLLQTVHKYCA